MYKYNSVAGLSDLIVSVPDHCLSLYFITARELPCYKMDFCPL